MIIIKYCGGLGNQMYQYAMKVVLKSRFPNQVFKDDISHYNLLNEHNGFELNKYFNIEFDFAKPSEIRKVYNGFVPGKISSKLPLRIRKKILYKYQYYYRKISDKLQPKKISKTLEESSACDFDWNRLRDGDWYISGMWQNTELFNCYREKIIEEFDWKIELDDKDKMICTELESGDSVAIHVRGGDYIKNAQNHYELCGYDYYKKTLQHITQEKINVYIFTDDIDYSKSIFQNMECINISGFVSHGVNDSIKDMYMLSRAKKLIIANSTFSFWGAYLNMCETSEIIAPKYAFYNGDEYVMFNHAKKWILVDNSHSL